MNNEFLEIIIFFVRLVPLDLDVKMKAVALGALFLIVSFFNVLIYIQMKSFI